MPEFDYLAQLRADLQQAGRELWTDRTVHLANRPDVREYDRKREDRQKITQWNFPYTCRLLFGYNEDVTRLEGRDKNAAGIGGPTNPWALRNMMVPPLMIESVNERGETIQTMSPSGIRRVQLGTQRVGGMRYNYVVDVSIILDHPVGFNGQVTRAISLFGLPLVMPMITTNFNPARDYSRYSYRAYYHGRDNEHWYYDADNIFVEAYTEATQSFTVDVDNVPGSSSNCSVSTQLPTSARTDPGSLEPREVPDIVRQYAIDNNLELDALRSRIVAENALVIAPDNDKFLGKFVPQMMLYEGGMTIRVGSTNVEFSNNNISFNGNMVSVPDAEIDTMFGKGNKADLTKTIPQNLFLEIPDNMPKIVNILGYVDVAINAIKVIKSVYNYYTMDKSELDPDNEVYRLLSKYDEEWQKPVWNTDFSVTAGVKKEGLSGEEEYLATAGTMAEQGVPQSEFGAGEDVAEYEDEYNEQN